MEAVWRTMGAELEQLTGAHRALLEVFGGLHEREEPAASPEERVQILREVRSRLVAHRRALHAFLVDVRAAQTGQPPT